MSREEEDLARELAEARARIAALEAHRDQILEALAVCRAQRLRAIASLEAVALELDEALDIVKRSRNP